MLIHVHLHCLRVVADGFDLSAGGGSGHAFKMGPALGDCAAALALGFETPLPIARFGVERLLCSEYRQEASRR